MQKGAMKIKGKPMREKEKGIVTLFHANVPLYQRNRAQCLHWTVATRKVIDNGGHKQWNCSQCPEQQPWHQVGKCMCNDELRSITKIKLWIIADLDRLMYTCTMKPTLAYSWITYGTACYFYVSLTLFYYFCWDLCTVAWLVCGLCCTNVTLFTPSLTCVGKIL